MSDLGELQVQVSNASAASRNETADETCHSGSEPGNPGCEGTSFIEVSPEAKGIPYVWLPESASIENLRSDPDTAYNPRRRPSTLGRVAPGKPATTVKILYCTNADIESSVALNLMLPEFARHDVCVAISPRIGPASGDEPAFRRELRVAEQTLAVELLFPLIEKAGLPDDGKRFLTFGELERHRGIRVASLPNANSVEGLAFVRGVAPDLILSVRYGSIFGAECIAIPALGVLNLHAGLLPAYRGVIAAFRALMNGDEELGCTLHYITDGSIDTGPVLGTARIPVNRARSLLWHLLQLYPGAAPMIADALDRLGRGEVPAGIAQSCGRYFSYPTEAEWQEFGRRGWRIADPSDLAATWRRYLPT